MSILLRGFLWILILIDREARYQLTTILFQLRLQLGALAKATAAAGVISGYATSSESRW